MSGPGSMSRRAALSRWFVPGLLIVCVVIVAFWEIMARRSARPFQPFDLTAEDFADFQPHVEGWDIRPIPVNLNDPLEPNILAYEGVRDGVRAQVRLVHGYNMPMCMKIKQYAVEEAEESGNPQGEPDARTIVGPASQPSARAVQAWLLTSPGGERSFWLTSILQAGDLGLTGVDIRTLAFPRVDVPDDPRWFPRGLTWSSLRHPIAGLRRYFRARWNAARADWLTFLRLRQPAWASEELLTYVSCSVAPALSAENEARVRTYVAELHAGVLAALQRWRRDAVAPPVSGGAERLRAPEKPKRPRPSASRWGAVVPPVYGGRWEFLRHRVAELQRISPTAEPRGLQRGALWLRKSAGRGEDRPL